jgi:hypothetical protein
MSEAAAIGELSLLGLGAVVLELRYAVHRLGRRVDGLKASHVSKTECGHFRKACAASLLALALACSLSGCLAAVRPLPLAAGVEPAPQAAEERPGESLADRSKRLGAELVKLKAEKAATDEALAQERTERQQLWVRLGAGLLLGAAVVLAGLGVWLQLRRLIIAALACAGCAGLAWTFAWLLPFLWILGAVAAAGTIVGVLLLLVRRDKALAAVVSGVEAAKAAAPGLTTTMRGFVTGSADTLVQHTRARLGLITKATP